MSNLITVFYDTEKLCREDEGLRNDIDRSIAHQYIVRKDGDVRSRPAEHRFSAPADIVVSPRRSFEAAGEYPQERVCVLNFASATHPGGGVRHGARAQEECLCRCSTLYFAIGEPSAERNFHKYHRELLRSGRMNSLYNDDCIFSPGITVVKTDTDIPQRLPEDERFKVDVITCAAPNLNSRYERISIADEELKRLHVRRARRILDIAVSEGEDVMILGAFGCGAFCNPPAIVAEAYREVIQDYLYEFRTIEFAVYCPPGSGGENLKVFSNVLKR